VKDAYLSAKEKWGFGLNEIPEFVEDYESSLDYVKRDNSILIQKYEDFFSDERSAAKQIASHLGISFTEDSTKGFEHKKNASTRYKWLVTRGIKWLVKIRKKFPVGDLPLEKRVFRRMARGSLNAMIDPDSQMHPDHISKRQGAVGGWVEELSDEEKALFVELGY
jgi:hypothetical protein